MQGVNNVQGVDLSQGIAGHPELTLVAIVNEDGNLVLLGDDAAESSDQEATPQVPSVNDDDCEEGGTGTHV